MCFCVLGCAKPGRMTSYGKPKSKQIHEAPATSTSPTKKISPTPSPPAIRTSGKLIHCLQNAFLSTRKFSLGILGWYYYWMKPEHLVSEFYYVGTRPAGLVSEFYSVSQNWKDKGQNIFVLRHTFLLLDK